MIQVTPVILCGGSGTRLWPLSRTGFPKQFLCLTGNESLFQQAAQRLASLGNERIQVAAPVLVSGEDHRIDDLSIVKDTHVILSPATGETAHGQEAGKTFVPILQPVVDIKYKRVR